MSCQPELRILETPSVLFSEAADEFTKRASQAILSRGRFCVALSGGSTPRGLYSLLAGRAASAVPWDKVFFFFGDERHVPPDHPDSNYRMANESMLSKIPLPAENVFRIRGEEPDADLAAQAYENHLIQFFGLKPGQFPRFDLVLLGLGPDGHIASLFPGSSGLNEGKRLVIANWVEKFKTHRITLTYPALNAARCDLFLVSGQDKAQVVRNILENPQADLPAQKVCPADGTVVWLLDKAAAIALSPLGSRLGS